MIGHYTTRADAPAVSRLAGIRLSKLVHIESCPGVRFYSITNQAGPGVSIPKQNSKTIGDTTEIKAIYELTRRGYEVAVPFGDNTKYDLVIDDEGDLHRVQCKTAWRTENDTIRFNTHSQTTLNGEYHETSYDGEIDAFIVRDPESEQLFWIDIEDANHRKMDLNYSAAIDHPFINWAEDYELGDEIPP